MTTTIKITQLTSIGASLATNTIVPVVNVAGAPVTQKTTVGDIAGVVLQGAGGAYPAAGKALEVSNAAQPSITSVGTLSSLHVAGTITANAIQSYSGSNVTITTGSSGYIWNFGLDGLSNIPGNVNMYGPRINIGENASSIELTSPTIVISSGGATYLQSAMVNTTPQGSTDWIAYPDNYPGPGFDHGWVDMGFTGSQFNDANYTITGYNDGYIFASGLSGGGGRLVLATDSTGDSNDIVFATGGFQIGDEFIVMSHNNNSFELHRPGSRITFPDLTILGEIEGANTIGFYNSNANTQFLLSLIHI